MDKLKRLVGIVAGLFCTLIVAMLCSYCFKLDVYWYSNLVKPSYLPPGGGFTVMVGISYISTIWVISRLVEHKHIFPSMFIFVFLGVFCILFVYAFFTLKMLVLALFFIIAVFALSFTLLIRFLIKDPLTALIYLPAFAFNSFCMVIVFGIVMCN